MPLPYDIEYCVQCMMEMHEFSADIGYFLEYEAEELLYEPLPSGEELIRIYDNWRETAPFYKKAFHTLVGLEGIFNMQAHDYMLGVTNDSIASVAGKPRLKDIRASLIKGTVQERFVRNLNRLLKFFDEEYDQYIENAAEIRQYRTLNDNLWQRQRDIEFGRIDILSPRQLVLANKASERKRRKVITRSVSLMQDFFGEADTKIFLGERKMSISGRQFIFHIESKKGATLSSFGHGAINVKVHDKEDRHLSDLCFYYDNMPVADQLVAFLLDIQSGNEDEILRVGNAFSVSELGYKNKKFAEMKNLKPKKKRIENENPDDIEWRMDNHLRRIVPHHDAIRKYHDTVKPIVKREFKKLYVDKVRQIAPVCETIFGRTNLLEFAA